MWKELHAQDRHFGLLYHLRYLTSSMIHAIGSGHTGLSIFYRQKKNIRKDSTKKASLLTSWCNNNA